MDQTTQTTETNSAGATPELTNAALPERPFNNPFPVAVAVIPVLAIDPSDGMRKTGVLAIRRSIPPEIGKLALPGGYINESEDWRTEVRRETGEEAQVWLPEEHRIVPYDLHSVPVRNVL